MSSPCDKCRIVPNRVISLGITVITFKVNGYTDKESNSSILSSFPNGISTLKEKTLLLWEEILSFLNRPTYRDTTSREANRRLKNLSPFEKGQRKHGCYQYT